MPAEIGGWEKGRNAGRKTGGEKSADLLEIGAERKGRLQ